MHMHSGDLFSSPMNHLGAPQERLNSLDLPCAISTGSEQLLASARQAFLQQTAALRNKVHSSYQRGIANTLTAMRVMHLVEDQASGTCSKPVDRLCEVVLDRGVPQLP